MKNLLCGIADINDITYKDNERYMAILYKNKTTKWVCRFYFNGSNKYITLPNENKKEIEVVKGDGSNLEISQVYDLENVLKRYL